MIRVDLQSMIVIYLLVMLGVLAVVWIGTEFVRSRRERRRLVACCQPADHNQLQRLVVAFAIQAGADYQGAGFGKQLCPGMNGVRQSVFFADNLEQA